MKKNFFSNKKMVSPFFLALFIFFVLSVVATPFALADTHEDSTEAQEPQQKTQEDYKTDIQAGRVTEQDLGGILTKYPGLVSDSLVKFKISEMESDNQFHTIITQHLSLLDDPAIQGRVAKFDDDTLLLTTLSGAYPVGDGRDGDLHEIHSLFQNKAVIKRLASVKDDTLFIGFIQNRHDLVQKNPVELAPKVDEVSQKDTRLLDNPVIFGTWAKQIWKRSMSLEKGAVVQGYHREEDVGTIEFGDASGTVSALVLDNTAMKGHVVVDKDGTLRLDATRMRGLATIDAQGTVVLETLSTSLAANPILAQYQDAAKNTFSCNSQLCKLTIKPDGKATVEGSAYVDGVLVANVQHLVASKNGEKVELSGSLMDANAGFGDSIVQPSASTTPSFVYTSEGGASTLAITEGVARVVKPDAATLYASKDKGIVEFTDETGATVVAQLENGAQAHSVSSITQDCPQTTFACIKALSSGEGATVISIHTAEDPVAANIGNVRIFSEQGDTILMDYANGQTLSGDYSFYLAQDGKVQKIAINDAFGFHPIRQLQNLPITMQIEYTSQGQHITQRCGNNACEQKGGANDGKLLGVCGT